MEDKILSDILDSLNHAACEGMWNKKEFDLDSWNNKITDIKSGKKYKIVIEEIE